MSSPALAGAPPRGARGPRDELEALPARGGEAPSEVGKRWRDKSVKRRKRIDRWKGESAGAPPPKRKPAAWRRGDVAAGRPSTGLRRSKAQPAGAGATLQPGRPSRRGRSLPTRSRSSSTSTQKRTRIRQRSRQRVEVGEAFWRHRRAEALQRAGALVLWEDLDSPITVLASKGGKLVDLVLRAPIVQSKALCEGCKKWTADEVDHVKGLGSGASRYKPRDSRNELENLAAMCHWCHVDKTEGRGKWAKASS